MTKISDFFRKTDVVLWLLTIAAVVYSMLLISSMQRADTYNYVRPQLAAIVVGMAAAILISFADYRFLIRRWYIALLVGIAMIILVFIIGIRVEGTDEEENEIPEKSLRSFNIFKDTVQETDDGTKKRYDIHKIIKQHLHILLAQTVASGS